MGIIELLLVFLSKRIIHIHTIPLMIRKKLRPLMISLLSKEVINKIYACMMALREVLSLPDISLKIACSNHKKRRKIALNNKYNKNNKI